MCNCLPALDFAVCQMWHGAIHVQRPWAPQLLSSKPWPAQFCAFITTWQTPQLSFFSEKQKNTLSAKSRKPNFSYYFFNIYSLNNIFLESKSWYYAKNRTGSDKREKGNLATQQFCLYQETSCIEFNGPALKAAVWITRGSNEENNTLTGSTKPWRTSLVPLYPLMQL